MKKWSLLGLLMFSLFSMLACNPQSDTSVLDRNSDIYAFASITSVDLLAYGNQTIAFPLASTNGPMVGDQLEDLNKYLNMMEKFLGGNDDFAFSTAASDRIEYASKVTFSATDILGESVVYVLYYNETPVEQSETDTTETEEENTEDDRSTDALEEVETRIIGVLVFGEMEYAVEGKKEMEADESKIEIESRIDAENYVRVVSKMEGSERKFEYTVVTNGVLVQSSVLKFEEEDNETKFDLAFLSGSTTGEYTFKQEIEDGETILKIRYSIQENGIEESGDIKILVVVDPVTGESIYSYHVKSDDGIESEIEKDREERHDSNDEEVDESEA